MEAELCTYHGDEVWVVQQAGNVQAAHASRLKKKHQLVVSGASLATLGKRRLAAALRVLEALHHSGRVLPGAPNKPACHCEPLHSLHPTTLSVIFRPVTITQTTESPAPCPQLLYDLHGPGAYSAPCS